MTCWKKQRLCELLKQPWNETKKCFHWNRKYTFQYKGCERRREKMKCNFYIKKFRPFFTLHKYNTVWICWKGSFAHILQFLLWIFQNDKFPACFTTLAALVVAAPGLTGVWLEWSNSEWQSEINQILEIFLVRKSLSINCKYWKLIDIFLVANKCIFGINLDWEYVTFLINHVDCYN